MKVLIVVYKFYSMPFMRYEIPLGLAYISAVLKRAGHLVAAISSGAPAFACTAALAPESPALDLLTSWCAASGTH